MPEVDDTSPQAERLQLELYRRMTPGQKLALVLDLIDTAEGFSRAGIRLRHPQASEQELTRRLAAIKYEHGSIPAPIDRGVLPERSRSSLTRRQGVHGLTRNTQPSPARSPSP